MAKQFKVAFTFGRFNLCHNGHLDLFKQMGQAANEVIIGVSTGAANLSIRDRTQTISHALAKDPDFNSTVQLVPKRQPFEFMAEIKLYNPNEVVLYLGQDQWELAKAFEQHAGITSVLIPRITSSSALRGMIDEGDWAMLSKYVPMSILNKVVQLRETERCLVSH
jgi:cytidyltransferase-like protein